MQCDTHFVYQCAACLTILGDSEAWDSANETLRAVLLRRTSGNLITVKELLTSTDKTNTGSTYHLLSCGKCGKVVGRLYRTTSAALESVKDKFALFVDDIMLYELGSGPVPEEAVGQTPISFTQLWTEVQKMQLILISMNKRLENIEQVMTDDGEVNMPDLASKM